jgi:hypothetical protein
MISRILSNAVVLLTKVNPPLSDSPVAVFRSSSTNAVNIRIEPPPIPSNAANLIPWTKSNFLAAVGLPVNVAPLDPGPCNAGGVTVRPVITAICTVIISTGRNAFLRATTKLTDTNNQGLVQKSALIEVINQCRKASIY